MRQPSIIILLISFIFLGTQLTVFPAVKGGIEYTIPTDYSKINEQEVELKAREYFFLAEKLPDKVLNEDMTNALMLYTLLQKVNPDKIEYPVKLGILYDKLGKDKYARGNFLRACGMESTNPLPCFYLAEFYYKRAYYRRALSYYKEAYSYGFDKNYDLLYKMGDIYEKLGDTRSALKYLKDAQLQSPNPDLDNKIRAVEAQDSVNKEFYSDTRIRG